jgi:nucleoside-diphosphate-sugar epimerase
MTSSFWRNKKVLITGGAGFIGSNIAARLVYLGSHIRVADNLERGCKDFLKPILERIDFQHVDLTESGACHRVCKGIEIVFHLASKVGGIGYYLSRPGDVILNNILIDSLMLGAALKTGVNYYLYSSSAHVYPVELQLVADASTIKEEQAIPAHPPLSYGWAKLIAEKQIEYKIEEGASIRAAIVRLIGAYGKNQDIELETGSAIPVFCRRAIEYPERKPFIIWGNGTETRSYCYIEDIIDGMLLSVEKLSEYNLVGPINVGSEDRVRIDDLAKMIIDISGKDIEILFDKTKKTVLGGQVADCSMANELLDGWRPKTPLKHGLERTYRHIQERLLSKGTQSL